MVDLKRGSYFAIRPRNTDISTFVPEWCAGNIYDMERAVSHAVALSSDLSFTEPTTFDLFVSGDYEARLGLLYFFRNISLHFRSDYSVIPSCARARSQSNN
jgi:hypothetical protein